ncbi:hypothetical protein [Mycoplasma sp. ATU-Cv-508]|uniref:hypothetical protein n=1 Tax=Mycoplasma sp. ATU-Cv-508 TaxID=2048001 RepID=UPI000FDF0956
MWKKIAAVFRPKVVLPSGLVFLPALATACSVAEKSSSNQDSKLVNLIVSVPSADGLHAEHQLVVKLVFKAIQSSQLTSWAKKLAWESFRQVFQNTYRPPAHFHVGDSYFLPGLSSHPDGSQVFDLKITTQIKKNSTADFS